MVSLCPDCRAVLMPGTYQRSQRGLTFKDEKSLLWRGLLLPGGAFFYAGWTLPGVLNAIFDTFLLVIALFWFLVALGVLHAPPPKPSQPPTAPAEALFITCLIACLIVFILALEKGKALVHCRRFVREFIPTR